MLKMKEKKQIKFSYYLFLVLVFVFFNSCAWWEKQKITSSTDLFSEGLGSQAPFIVSQVEKSPNKDAISITHGTDGLAKIFTLNLKTCLRDYIRQDNPIQNISFIIEYYKSSADKKNNKLSKETAVSDTQGCIQWQEEYSYKYTVKPLWIGLERVIKKEKGAYTGMETIPMAVNPWLSERDRKSGLPYILDIRPEYSRGDRILREIQNYEKNGLNYLSETKEEEKPLLWVPDLDFQIHEINPAKDESKNNSGFNQSEQEIRNLLSQYQTVCHGRNSKNCYRRQMEMNLYIPLKLRTLDRSGLREDELLGGTYDIETQLVITPKGTESNYRLHESKCEKKNIEINQTNKTLTSSCILNFTYFNQNALYKLVIRINPSSKELPFKKFEGVYTINLEFQDNKQNLKIDTGYEENYETVLTTSEELEIIESMNIPNTSLSTVSENLIDPKTKANAKKTELYVDQKGPIKGLSFYRLHLDGYGEYKLSHVESGGSECSQRENVVERTVVFVGKLCLKDVLSSQQLNNTPFRVFLEKPKEGTIKEIFFHENEKEELFKTNGQSCISVPIPIKHKIYDRQKYFQIDMHVLSEELNLYGKVRLALSPWQRAFQAFQDAQNLPEKDIRFDTTGIPKPQLIINQFRSINLFPSYGLDKLLNIHLFHRFYLLFQPFIRRPDNLSLGLDFRSRELLRDGHYLVRVLILRNPQETGAPGKWSRAQSSSSLNKMREQQETDEYISLEGAQYITHTDSVVKAKANFINFYMPLFLSTKQFYYIASRNFIVIEVHPADPSYFKYNKDRVSGNDDECIVDAQKTTWKPYRHHELENAPYVGAFNIQQWVNWNLLQPAKDIDTDAIIESSEIGRKYKHFNFSRSESEKDKPLSSPLITDCVGEVYGEDEAKAVQQIVDQDKKTGQRGILQLDFDESEKDVKENIKKCDEGLKGDLNPGLESYKRSEEKYFSEDVLESFSKENSLKLIDLSHEDSERFIKDMGQSFEKYRLSHSSYDLSKLPAIIQDTYYRDLRRTELLNYLPEEDKNLLRFRMDEICVGKTKRCPDDILKAYLETLKMMSEQTLQSRQNLPIQSIVNLVNKNQLLPSSDRKAFNKINQEHEDFKSSWSALKKYSQIVLNSYMNDLSFYDQNLFLENLMTLFSKQQKQQLYDEIKQQCFPWYAVLKSSEDYRECYYDAVRMFYEKTSLNNTSDIYQQAVVMGQNLFIDNILKGLNSSSGTKDGNILKSMTNAPSKQSLYQLISAGIKNNNKYAFPAVSFTKPLCFFWFDHYLKKYLEADQMIGAYINFMSQFDYNQILDRNSFEVQDLMSVYPAVMNFLTHYDNEPSAGCYEDYTQCVLADHCLKRSVNQSKNTFCSQLDLQDKTCPALLKEECQKDSSLSLCREESLLDANSSCNTAVRDFCLTNVDHQLCGRYENRCAAEYAPCLKSNTSVFNIDQVLNYKENDSNFGPLKTCLNNPYDFFEFENKMVVHELSQKKKKYLGGFLETLNVAANYSIGSYLNWTAQRGRSITASSDAGISGTGISFKKLSKKLSSLFSLSAKMGVSQSISSNESNSGRRAIDNRAGESVYFTIGKAEFEVGVKKFQNCLVVRPRPNAFNLKPEEGTMESLDPAVWSKSANEFKKILVSRPGLILCNPVEDRGNEDPKYIEESYYYVSQMVDSGNSEFLNLYDLANRPFVLVLRGRKEFVKLYHILKMTIDGDNGVIEENGGMDKPPENMFVEYPFPVEEAVGLSLTIREFNQTGFAPGIYHYPDDSDQYLDVWYANRDGKNNFIMEALSEYNLFDVPSYTDKEVPIQER